MELLSKNPFNSIKANDLNDSEINNQWVDLPNNSFADLFAPKSRINMFILGGKGSGKTHLMRYYSYQAQLVRNEADPCKGIIEDGYLGIYFQASGLHGSRFENLPIDNEEYKLTVFCYYFDLWVAGQLCDAISTITSNDPSLTLDESSFCADVLDLFESIPEEHVNISSTQALHKFITGQLKSVEYEVNNAFFKPQLDIKILTSRSKLIFGIPQALKKNASEFKDTNFLYLIDELENISELQQKYVNTLIRERALPVSFRVGARRHGIHTQKTLGYGEINKEGHEFEVIRLDDTFSNEREYSEFATKLILNRLAAQQLAPKDVATELAGKDASRKRKSYLDSLFEKADISSLKEDQGLSPTIKSFISKLPKGREYNLKEEISQRLSFPSDLIAEKAGIHLFCQKWKKQPQSERDLIILATEVSSELEKYANDCENEIATKITYFNNNYVSSVLRNKRKNNYDSYSGIDNLLKITKGFPRHILTVLRHIYRIEAFEGNMPFIPDKKISINTQRLALKEASDWFHDDCVSEGALGNKVNMFLDRLCSILRIDFYADKPNECSSSSFSIRKTELSDDAIDIIEWAKNIRVIIPADSLRPDKNTQKTLEKFHLNGLLCPRWGLPINRRGELSLNDREASLLLDAESKDDFEAYLKSFEAEVSAPYEIKKPVDEGQPQQQGLNL